MLSEFQPNSFWPNKSWSFCIFPSDWCFLWSCHLMNQAPGVCRAWRQGPLANTQQTEKEKMSAGAVILVNVWKLYWKRNLMQIESMTTDHLVRMKIPFTWISQTAIFLPKKFFKAWSSTPIEFNCHSSWGVSAYTISITGLYTATHGKWPEINDWKTIEKMVLVV